MLKIITALTLLTLPALAGTWLIEGTPSGTPSGPIEETLRLDQTVQQTISNGAVRINGKYVYEEAFAPSFVSGMPTTPAIHPNNTYDAGSAINNTTGSGLSMASYEVRVFGVIFLNGTYYVSDYGFDSVGYIYFDGSSEASFSIDLAWYEQFNSDGSSPDGFFVEVCDNNISSATYHIYVANDYQPVHTFVINDPTFTGWTSGPAYGYYPAAYYPTDPGALIGYQEYSIYAKRTVNGQIFYSPYTTFQEYYYPSYYSDLYYTENLSWTSSEQDESYIVVDYNTGHYIEVPNAYPYDSGVVVDGYWGGWSYNFYSLPQSPLVIISDILVASNEVALAKINADGQFESVETNGGVSPFKTDNTTLNNNFNADLLDGAHASSFALASEHMPFFGGSFTDIVSYPFGNSATNTGIKWTARSKGVPGKDWRSVAYGSGLFVAVTYTGETGIMTSRDGVTWTEQTTGMLNSHWSSVTYGNGLFVAVGGSGSSKVATSPDGINWTARSACGDDDSWKSVTYGNGLFVAVASFGNNRVMTSADGMSWTARPACGDNDNWFAVTYGNGTFVAVGAVVTSVTIAMTSPDGINWTARWACDNNDDWMSVTYGNGLFVAVAGWGNRVMTSPNGASWTARSACGDNDYWRSVTYGNGLFVAVSSEGDTRAMTSSDGVNWTPRPACGDNDSWFGLTFGDDTFVAVGREGDYVMTSGIGGSEIVNYRTMTDYVANAKIIRWQDTIVSGLAIRAGAQAPNREQVSANSGIYGTAFDVNDDGDYAAQVQHGAASTNASFLNFYYNPHLHVSINSLAAPNTNATFVLTYQIAPVNSNYTSFFISRTGTVSWATSPSERHFNKILDFGFVTNNALQGADSIVIRGNIKRIATPVIGNDVPTHVFVDSLDYHFPMDSVGSSAIFGDAP